MKLKTPDAASFESADIPQLLRHLREASGLTQTECAKKMGSENMRQYQQYEDGTVKPSLELLERLLAIFNLQLGLIALSNMTIEELLKNAAFNKTGKSMIKKLKPKTILRKAL